MIPEKILYAEDELDVRGVTLMALTMVGKFMVTVCSDGAELLQKVEAFQPDLVILDVMMPVMDGPTCLKHLRANPKTAHIPVIFFTAKVLEKEIAQYLEMGALGVISKPFDPMTLPAQIRKMTLPLWGRTVEAKIPPDSLR